MWAPVGWKNLRGPLNLGVPVELDRPSLWYTMTPLRVECAPEEEAIVNKGWWDGEPVFLVWDRYWLRRATDHHAPTNEGIEKEKEAALAALPALEDMEPKDIRVRGPQPGVESRRNGHEFVRLSDGKGITRYHRKRPFNHRDFDDFGEYLKKSRPGPSWLEVPGRRKKVSFKEQQEFMDLVHPEDDDIRNHAVNTQHSRDYIGHLIEMLRYNGAIQFEAEIDGKFRNVDWGAPSPNGGSEAKPVTAECRVCSGNDVYPGVYHLVACLGAEYEEVLDVLEIVHRAPKPRAAGTEEERREKQMNTLYKQFKRGEDHAAMHGGCPCVLLPWMRGVERAEGGTLQQVIDGMRALRSSRAGRR